MKRFITAAIVVFISTGCFSQSAILSSDTLILQTGQRFIKGSVITLGKGSRPDGSFSFVTTTSDKIGKNVVMPVNLMPSWTGYKMKIDGFKLVGNDITGKRYYLELTIDEKRKPGYVSDIENAVSSGEILL